MPEDEKNEKTTEEKIAQSTGNETVKYGQELEDEADALIKQAYGDTGDKGGDKDDDKSGKDDEDGNDADDGKDGDEDGEGDGEDDVNKIIDPEIKALLDKLDKSEKRVKDTRADHTRGRQELKAANERAENLENAVFKLKSQVEELSKASTAKTENKTEKAVAKTTGDIQERIAEMEKLDPDLAATMKPIVENMFGEIENLKSELATEKQNAKDKAIEDANEAHFRKLDNAHDGWEDTMQTPEFADYLQGLSPRAKRLALIDLNGGTADNIIEIFDDFKDSQGVNDDDAKKGNKLEKARTLSNPTNKKAKNINTGVKKMLFTRSQINAMSPEEFAKNEDAIDRAMANGQIEQI